MTMLALADELGPRGRRRVIGATAVSGAVVAGLVVLAVARLVQREQFTAAKWRPLGQWPVIRFLLGGLANTLKAALLAMALSLAVGALLALGRLAKGRPVRWLTGAYVHFFRGVPVLLLMYFSARGLPRLNVELSLLQYLVLALVAYNGAVLAEIFRAGILSLERGQSEAAYAIGLSYWQTMRLVLIPQAVRRMVPAIVSQLVTLLKDTSLGFILPYEELLRRGRIVGEFGQNLLQTVTVVAVIYFTVNFVLSRIARRLEVRQRRRYHAGRIQVAGVEDLAVVGAQGEGRAA